MFYSIVCHLLLEVKIGICNVRNSVKKKKVLHPTDVIDSTFLYFCTLQSIEGILEPSSHFSLLLSYLKFTRNRRKHLPSLQLVYICIHYHILVLWYLD